MIDVENDVEKEIERLKEVYNELLAYTHRLFDEDAERRLKEIDEAMDQLRQLEFASEDVLQKFFDEKLKEGKYLTVTEDCAVALINEWLELAKEVGDMSLNRIEYDEDRYEYAMARMDVIRKAINDYHDQMLNRNKC